MLRASASIPCVLLDLSTFLLPTPMITIHHCIVNYAGVAADTVYNMLEDSQGSKFNEAGVHLRTAAGIFERLHKVMTTAQSRANPAAYFIRHEAKS